MEAAEYLRKSRMEEGMDTEEVLSKHRAALASYASAHDIHIVDTYYEVRSGESLYARPEMLRLLEDVEAGKYEAVLVMDLDRLSRGRMKDQGIILDAFREAGTLIITPEKTYDLNDEIDDELAEFKTFMSRREYKIINKRLRRGLQQSINSGCYVANAPYGYRKTSIDRKPTLEIYEPEAKFVRMIFDLYLQGYGCVAIARELTLLGSRPHRSDRWNRSSIAHIIRNPTFTGKVVWNQKSHIKKGAKGNPKHITIYNPREKWTITDGLHPAIIDQETYDKAQEIMAGRYHPSPNDGTIKSPLAGLVRCAKCGIHMQRFYAESQGKVPYLMCRTTGCCASAKFEYVEAAILELLRQRLQDLTLRRESAAKADTAPLEAKLAAARKELAAANSQKARLYELLELQEYDLPTFRERMAIVRDKITGIESLIGATEHRLRELRAVDTATQAKRLAEILDAYEDSDAPHRNAVLKSVIDVIWYTKAKKTKPMDFELEIVYKPN